MEAPRNGEGIPRGVFPGRSVNIPPHHRCEFPTYPEPGIPSLTHRFLVGNTWGSRKSARSVFPRLLTGARHGRVRSTATRRHAATDGSRVHAPTREQPFTRDHDPARASQAGKCSGNSEIARRIGELLPRTDFHLRGGGATAGFHAGKLHRTVMPARRHRRSCVSPPRWLGGSPSGIDPHVPAFGHSFEVPDDVHASFVEDTAATACRATSTHAMSSRARAIAVEDAFVGGRPPRLPGARLARPTRQGAPRNQVRYAPTEP